MNIDIGSYQLRPHSNGLCWGLWQHREVKKKDGGVSMEWKNEECYCTTLAQALQEIRKRMEVTEPATLPLADAIVRIEEFNKALVAAANKLEKQVRL